MRRYDDGEFIQNEPKRRAIRDEFRDKFFTELGIQRLKDPFTHDPDPTSQLAVVKSLMSKALEVHVDETSALSTLQRLVSDSALGVPLKGLGTTSGGRPDFQSTTIERMFESTFHRWFGSANYDNQGNT